MFGPGGKLYVSEYSGNIKIFTVERTGAGQYSVLSMEVLSDIKNIQDHNDDGSFFSNSNRETTGLTVSGTAANPIIYATSSDFRIGGGGGGTSDRDIGLDTNSGIITQFSWNGSSWDVIDLVRGLPRSEENHATNGLEFITVNGTDYLIVTQGGHTNAGAPSNNFGRTVEYALSGAVLSVNLNQINALPILNDNGRNYIYDIPTLDDPSRANSNGITDPDNPSYNGIDVNDPFGGNDGLNQAVVVTGGPVQIFSPGYRNTYDVVVTESGAVYATDNGANGGWGGLPESEGGGSATNDYNSSEPGSSTSIGGEQVNNEDHLTLITNNIQNYNFGSFYGGHPNPTRANPNGAGLYTRDGNITVFRTQVYDPDGSTPGSTTNAALALPANWPPVQTANTVEGDWRGPGISNPDGPNDAIVTIWGTNTNGIDEYTASNFGGVMKGDLIAGKNGGILRRVELKADGSLENLTSSFASGLGGNALGITCNGDLDPYPGTIWVASFNGNIVILEPQDFGICIEPTDPNYDPLADNDSDGYTNQDEVDNGTDPCNGGSQPNDFDKAAGAPLVSDLNDNDDDNDGVIDANDPLQLGNINSSTDAYLIPVENELFSDTGLGGYQGLGLTGLMNNGDTNSNWLNWLDRRDDSNDPNPNDILGGAIGAMTMQMTSGNALGTTNTQEKGFQYGIQTNEASGVFTVSGSIVNFNAPLQLYGNSAASSGELGFFIGDGTQSNYIKFVITPTELLVMQEINDVPQTPITTSILQNERPNAEVSFYFVVNSENGMVDFQYAFDGGNKTVLGNLQAQGPIVQAIQQSNQNLIIGLLGTSNTSGVELEGTWDFLNVDGEGVLPSGDDILYRVNAGGPEIAAIDGNIVWSADTDAANSPFLIEPASNNVAGFAMTSYINAVDQTTTPISIFASERYDNALGTPNMSYSFPVSQPGNYEVRLYMGNGFTGTGAAGQRIFNVELEGQAFPDLTSIDLSGTYGDKIGAVISNTVTVADGSIDIVFLHGPIENPLVNGIEIIGVANSGNPIAVQPIADQNNVVGETLNGTLTLQAIGGDGPLVYSAAGLPNGVTLNASTGQITGAIANGAELNSPYNVSITVDDTDTDTSDSTSVNFIWTIEGPTTVNFVRINAAGTLLTATDGNVNWNANDTVGAFNDGAYSVNSGLIFAGNVIKYATRDASIPSYIDEATFDAIFAQERYSNVANPDMEFLIPLIDGDYVVNLFLGNSFAGASQVGNRVFGISLEGNPVVTDLDLVAQFGHQVGGMVSFPVNVLDGELNISFQKGIENPLINAIEVRPASISGIPIVVQDIVNQTNTIGDVLDGSLTVIADGGDGNLNYSAQGLPPGVNIEPTNGQIGGAIDNSAQINTPYNITVTVDDSDSDTLDVQTVIFSWTILGNGTNNIDFTIVDAANDGDISSLVDGQEINILVVEGKFLNIRANIQGTPGSVQLDMSGPTNETFLDNIAPYAIFGDDAGSYSGRQFSLGNYTLTATSYSGVNATGSAIETSNITFSIVDGPVVDIPIVVQSISNQINNLGYVLNGSLSVSASGGDGELNFSAEGLPPGISLNPVSGQISGRIGSTANTSVPYQVVITVDDGDTDTTDTKTVSFSWTAQEVISSSLTFTIVDAANDGDVTDLVNNQQLNFSDVDGRFLNIRANVQGVVGSVQFAIDGPKIDSSVDNIAPFALYGDDGGSYSGSLFSIGNYTLTATSYENSDATGTVLETSTIEFSIVDGINGNLPPTAIAVATPLSGIVPLKVNFDASASSDDQAIVSYSWNFGDGTFSSLPNPLKTYTEVGVYQAILTVEDADGAQDTDTVTITVSANQTDGVLSFTLIDAFDDGEVLALTDGLVIDLADIQGRFLNVRANTNPAQVGSVSFTLLGELDRLETDNAQPYSLFGDVSGSYSGVLFSEGSYTLTATSFDGTDGQGNPSTPKVIQFSIVNVSGVASRITSSNLSDIRAQDTKGLMAFPNPAKEQLFVANLNTSLTVKEVNVFSMAGQMVMSFNPKKHMTFENGLYSFNVSTLPSGTYFIDVLMENGPSEQVSFIKQ